MTDPDPTDPGVALLTNTSTGLPYPESTDALNQGANAIKALALALTAQLPIKRVVLLGGVLWAASGGSASVPSGLTTVTGAVISPISADAVLITLANPAFTGANVNLRVFLSGSAFTGNFMAYMLAWGT